MFWSVDMGNYFTVHAYVISPYPVHTESLPEGGIEVFSHRDARGLVAHITFICLTVCLSVYSFFFILFLSHILFNPFLLRIFFSTETKKFYVLYAFWT